MNKRTKKTVSVAGKVFSRLLLGIVLCAILFVSMETISTGIFGNEVGYRVIEQVDENTAIYREDLEYHYKVGESSEIRSNLELEKNQMAEPIIETPRTTQTIIHVISQILMLIVFGIFPYHILWQFGSRDDTNVRYKGQRPDPWRGVKVGLLAMVPFALFWVVLLLAKFMNLNGYFQFYNLINFPYMPYNTWVLGSFNTISDVALWRLLLLLPTLLFVPIVSGIAYRMGGRRFSISEFITFSKKKEKTEEEEEI